MTKYLQNTGVNMKLFRQIKRNFLIRLMAVLGFGGMTAFCLSSCQSSSANNDKQPKHEASDSAASEAPQPAADSNQADSVTNPEPVDNSAYFEPAPDPDFGMPVKKYGIPSALPPDAYEHLDEMQVPPTPEANEQALRQRFGDDNDEPANLTPEYTEEQLMNDPPPPAVDRPVKKYGIVRPSPKYGVRPPVQKYGVIPPKEYGIKRDL